jgi:hypothetical protein
MRTARLFGMSGPVKCCSCGCAAPPDDDDMWLQGGVSQLMNFNRSGDVKRGAGRSFCFLQFSKFVFCDQ